MAIAAAIVGSSFLIWLVPRNNDIQSPSLYSYQDVYSSVYAKNNVTATQVDALYQNWSSGKISSGELLTKIDQSLNQTQQLQDDLSQTQPSLQWQQAFSEYRTALDSFTKYLHAIRSVIDSGSRGQDSTVEMARQEWLQHVDKSVSAIPLS